MNDETYRGVMEENKREDLVFATAEKVDLLAESLLRGKKRGPKEREEVPVDKKRAPKSYVWQRMDPPYRVGLHGFTYGNIPYYHERVDPKMYLPLAFDLVTVILEAGREVPGWHDGVRWEGPRLQGRKVEWWKRDLYAYL